MVSSRTQPGSRELAALTASARSDARFVQVAGAAVVSGHRLALEDLAPTTVWLLNGAPTTLGHMATGTFLDLWWDPASGLATSALHAVLGRADADTQLLGDTVLRVWAPRIVGSGIQYDMEVLNGALARRTGACVLFLGPGDPETRCSGPR